MGNTRHSRPITKHPGGGLEMDFILEGNDSSMHILNAVSPGFTCALPFAKYVCDKIDSKLS